VGLTSGLKGDKALEHYGHEVLPGLLVVPAGPVPSDPALLEVGRFVEIVRGLEAGRDVVILDAPVARRVLRSANLLGGFDGLLLVIHASRTSKSTARETTDDLLAAGTNLLGVVLNGVIPGERA
jgi:Mrp family chromosome partitioning ATPase